MTQIIECVPNFSEGRDNAVINEIAAAIKSVEGAKLLHQDSGYSAHRTVYTFAGTVEAVLEAAYQAIKVAGEKIDMQKHQGEHPRIGACDVCPFVPLEGISMNELSKLVEEFAERINSDFDVPIFFYEENANSENRRNLAKHRVGNYEALQARMQNGKWKADLGNFNAKFGGMVLGARPFLVAYNINLNLSDPKIAQEIAYDLRELGRPIGRKNGRTIFKPGKLKQVKAIGWYIKEFKKAQVSINLINYKETPLHLVYESCKEIARNYNAEVTGSELIGLTPKAALIETGKFYNSQKDATEIDLIESAIQNLGLDELQPFNPQKRILENLL